MADDLYGPYVYQDCILDDSSFAPGYDTPTWPNGYKQGRHGNFFEWNGQWYITYCDISQSGNRWFRDAFISYVHYNDDGTIAPLRVNGIGVGWHPANMGVIPAEEYFTVEGMRKEQDDETGFRMVLDAPIGRLYFPKVKGLNGRKTLTLRLGSAGGGDFRIKVTRKAQDGPLVGTADFTLEPLNKGYGFGFVELALPALADEEDFFFEFVRVSDGELRFDGFFFR